MNNYNEDSIPSGAEHELRMAFHAIHGPVLGLADGLENLKKIILEKDYSEERVMTETLQEIVERLPQDLAEYFTAIKQYKEAVK